MKNYFRYSFFCLLSILQACNSGEEKTSNLIKIDPDQSVTAKLSEHFVGIDYILLDYPDSLPIVNAYAMVFTEDNILVESRETAAIFIFDRRGKLQRVIREYGEGPGEFVLIDDLNVNNNHIVINARPRKELTFDFEGNLLREVKLLPGTDKSFRGKDFHLHHFQQGNGDEKWTFQRVSGVDVQGFLPLKKGHETFIRKGAPWGFSFDPFRKQVYMVEPNTYNIQVFNKDGYWKDSIAFDFGKFSFDSKKRMDLATEHQERHFYLKDNSKVDNMTTFNGFRNFLMLTFHLQGMGNHTVFLNDELGVISQVNDWENDFDGMKVYNSHWAFTENETIYHLNSRTFYKDYVASFQGKKVEVKSGNVHDFFEKNREKLMEEKLVLVVLKVR